MSGERLPYFERLYGASDDPYGLRARWYERRKRALLLACLPQERFATAYEPGCGSGELTAALAARCDHLLASDFSEGALAAARSRTQGLANVQIARHALPQDWPAAQGPFALIVLSELGYFLDADAMQALALHCRACLAEGGTLVACDWRPDFKERALPTQAVHAALEGLGLPRLLRHEEDDFLLQLWSRDGRSVARREGIR
jgi:SAM-dependent methyltransferase